MRLLAIAAVLLIAVGQPARAPEDPWLRAYGQAIGFAAEPSKESAESLIEALRPLESVRARAVCVSCDLYPLLAPLERLAASDAASALKLGFILRSFSDAAFSFDLEDWLGSQAAKEPLAFLTAVQEQRQRVGTDLLRVVLAVGDRDEKEARAELQNRRVALERLAHPALEELRSEALALLRQGA